MILRYPTLVGRLMAGIEPRHVLGPLLGAALLGLTACASLPYTGPPDPSSGETLTGRNG